MEKSTVSIKVHICAPDLELELEIKREQPFYKLIIVRSKNHIPNDQGQIWHATIVKDNPIDEVIELICKCAANPSKPKRITINDGMHVTFNVAVDGNTTRMEIKDFEAGMPESTVLHKIFELAETAGVDASFGKYKTQIESYTR